MYRLYWHEVLAAFIVSVTIFIFINMLHLLYTAIYIIACLIAITGLCFIYLRYLEKKLDDKNQRKSSVFFHIMRNKDTYIYIALTVIAAMYGERVSSQNQTLTTPKDWLLVISYFFTSFFLIALNIALTRAIYRSKRH